MEKWVVPLLVGLLSSLVTFVLFVSRLRERIASCEKEIEAMTKACAGVQRRKETDRVELRETLERLTKKVDGLGTDLTKQIADLTLEVRVMNGREDH